MNGVIPRKLVSEGGGDVAVSFDANIIDRKL